MLTEKSALFLESEPLLESIKARNFLHSAGTLAAKHLIAEAPARQAAYFLLRLPCWPCGFLSDYDFGPVTI